MPSTSTRNRERVPTPNRPVFSVRFTEGLATRNRLPLEHVIRVLNEIKGLIEEAGKRLQRERGDENPTGDFGLELVAGFKRGSVQASIEMTKDEQLGALVGMQILDAVDGLSSPTPTRRARSSTERIYDPRMVARIGNIAKVQELGHTRTIMSLRTGEPKRRPKRATLNDVALKNVKALRARNWTIEGLTIYGKLRELHDKFDHDDSGRKVFYGELLSDDGIVWRVEFKPEDLHRVGPMFRSQVFVTGDATYYSALAPKLKAITFGRDEHRDYEDAFDELFGSIPELAGLDPADTLGDA